MKNIPLPIPENHPSLLQAQPHRQLLADIFDISQFTISRTTRRVEDALFQLSELKTSGLEALKDISGSLVVEGTLVPVFTRIGTIFQASIKESASTIKSSARCMENC